MHSLVTGSAGFIGKHLIHKLKSDGNSVIALNRSNGDIALKETWSNLPTVKTIIHLAGRSYVPDSWENSGDFAETNIVGTQRALDFCKKTGANMVYINAYPYGNPEKLPINENAAINPNNPYSLTKQMGAQLCEFANNYSNVTTTVLRLFNVYGAFQRKNFLIPSIIDQVLHKKEITVMDLNPRRDYVYIGDVVTAIIKSMELARGFNSINIGSGVSYSVSNVIRTIQLAANTDLNIVSKESERINEVPDVVADISKAKKVLDWSPIYSFKEGIKLILQGMAYEQQVYSHK